MEDYKTGHRKRLRKRMERGSIDAMRSHEILEFLLCYAVPRVDMNETARILIHKFGSLKNVLDAAPEDLMSVKGVGKAVVEWLGIVREIVESYSCISPFDHKRIIRLSEALEYVAALKKKVHPPESMVIFLDFNNRIMMKRSICNSLDWCRSEFTREIIRDAVRIHAKSVILALYPGNVPMEYEESDIQNILNFSRSLRAVQMELLDCIISGETYIKSLDSCGVMDIIRNESRHHILHEEYIPE